MAQIKEDPSKYADFIIENGYTGLITPNNVADIIWTITVSICTSKATIFFIFGSLSPMYSGKGSSNRVLEMKCRQFPRFLLNDNDLEDNDMKNTREEHSAYNESNEKGNRQVSLVKLTPSGILGWLTGQKT